MNLDSGATAGVISHYLSQLNHCIATRNLTLGRAFHSHLLKTSLNLHTLLANRLVDLYSKCNSLLSARLAFLDLPSPNRNAHSFNTLLSALSRSAQIPAALHLFDRMPHRNLVSYSTIISTLTHHGHPEKALKLFVRMRKEQPFCLDKFTVVGVSTACAALRGLKSLRQLHGAVIVIGLEINLIMSNVLIDGYGKCGDVDAARLVFEKMGVKDVVSWTSLIGALSCAGRMEEACHLFERMPKRNAVTWTALVSGYEQNGQEEAAVELFERMVGEGVGLTPFTLVSVLSAIARLGLTGRGKEVHGYMVRRCFGFDSFNIFTYNALVDMYSKCGDMGSASSVFDSMPERDVVTWNSMVTGFAQNGLGMQSLAIFERMTQAGVMPNKVTFLGVLSACSHAGLVSEGRQVLNSMEEEYGVRPSPEHYAAFVDALGRQQRLEEAAELIEDLSSKSIGTWGALLGACRVHGNLELGKRAAESLFELEPENGARYVSLSNIYAAAGRWDEARQVRMAMKGKGLRKEAGCSWIEVKSVKHVFLAEDCSHCQSEEIYGLLEVLVDKMKEENMPFVPCLETALCSP